MPSASSPMRASSSGFVQWPLAIAGLGAVRARGRRALSLRTRGVYFIMITLAFAQMVYYVGVGLDRYGADDGLTISPRSQFAGLARSLRHDRVLLSSASSLLLASIYLAWRLVNSRFGMVIQGARSNDRRMQRDRLPDLSLSARLFRHRRRDLRARRRAARQSHRLHQPGDDALDALGRSHRHGGARRHGLAVRPADRRRGASGAGGGAADLIGRSAICSSAKRRCAQRNTGRSCSARCCCWSCCSRAAASTASDEARDRG